MFSKSTWLHLRIPFSYFLLPIFFFALALTPNLNPFRLLIVFVAVHFFLYPASNGFNSYFDKDKESIGGLRNPPEVRKGLYYMALVFDLIALILGALINKHFVWMLLVYGLVSKAYSHPTIRLKKYPWGSWFVAGFFQGAFSFSMMYMALSGFDFSVLSRPHVLMPAALCSLMLWASYPMTQIYQHKEDQARGDQTLSLLLGIRGTFVFTAAVFTLSTLAFFYYFQHLHSLRVAWVFVGAMAPVGLYFIWWTRSAWTNPAHVNYTRTMWLNTLSATALNVFFIWFFLEYTQVAQVLKMGI
jgi:4-hydroxybenzoate polyprenyltransferase